MKENRWFDPHAVPNRLREVEFWWTSPTKTLQKNFLHFKDLMVFSRMTFSKAFTAKRAKNAEKININLCAFSVLCGEWVLRHGLCRLSSFPENAILKISTEYKSRLLSKNPSIRVSGLPFYMW
jgi:hypothetical protein